MQDRLSPEFVRHALLRYHEFMTTNLGLTVEKKKPTSKPRPGRINMDLMAYKKPWRDWCAAKDLEPSDAFRKIVARLTSQPAPVAGNVAHDAPEKPTARREIKLTASEDKALEALAAAEGFSPTKWIVSLIRARLTGTAQYGQRELELLDRSNMRLLAIGRNLNQVAKALNASPADYSLYRVELIEDLQKAIKEHTRTVSDAIAANVSRWRIE